MPAGTQPIFFTAGRRRRRARVEHSLTPARTACRASTRICIRGTGFAVAFSPGELLLPVRFAGVELEGRNAGVPVKTSRSFVVLLRVPEGAVIAGVYRHAAVIAPALERHFLDSTAAHQDERACHCSRRIARRTPHQENTWIQIMAGSAEAERDVTCLVHGNTSQPEIYVGINHRALLEGKGRRPRTANFIPPDTG